MDKHAKWSKGPVTWSTNGLGPHHVYPSRRKAGGCTTILMDAFFLLILMVLVVVVVKFVYPFPLWQFIFGA